MIKAMRAAGFKPAVWIPIICVLLTATLAWGAWNTMATTNSTPRPVFDEHVEDDRDRFDSMQRRLEDKMDKIQEILIDKLGD